MSTSTFANSHPLNEAPPHSDDRPDTMTRFFCVRNALGLMVFAAFLFALAPIMSAAQANAVPERLAAKIDEGQITQLKGSLHPLARPQNDLGPVDPALKLPGITIMFQPTPAQKADLDALLSAQQNPTSANFHKWLTPQQYGERFGIAPGDLTKISAWLQSKGFVIVETPESRTSIIFSGTAAQASAAFHTEIHNYQANGQKGDQKFFANNSELSVPAALAGIVAGFRGLDNYRLKPRLRPSGAASNPAVPVKPDFSSPSVAGNYLAPGDFAKIYDLNTLYSASIDGTGQRIAIVGQSQIVPSDVGNFRQISGLPPYPPNSFLMLFTNIGVDPGIQQGDVQESSADVEWAGAVAKGASIDFIYGDPINANGVMDALAWAIGHNSAPVISMSYGSCEAANSASFVEHLVSLAQQANAQGITITTSIGDAGATDCDSILGDYPATLGLSVDLPGSMPYVTAVGGTEFNEGTGSYWQTPTTTDIPISAQSYIPEIVWNDSLAEQSLSATGGGASSLFAKPSWQTGVTGVPADGARDVPDIAVNASNSHDTYLFCTELPLPPSTQFPTTPSCQNGFHNSTTDASVVSYGGTSFGAPTFAGIVALINQETKSTGQGNINYLLYPLAASNPSAFHDITSGDNTSPCAIGSVDCPAGTPIGFSAGTGYDLATGLGSFDAFNMVSAWTGGGASGSMPTLSSISPTSATSNSGDFTLTATGSGFATNAQILWNASAAGVTMLPGGTSTTLKATISNSLIAFGTVPADGTYDLISVTNDASKSGESGTQQFTVTGVPPRNDNVVNAIPVTTSNFISTVDNSAATTEATDPFPPCVSGLNGSMNPDTKTVWWTLTATGSANVLLTTMGSSYDTTLSVWTGSPGNFAIATTSNGGQACNDDIVSGQITTSMLNLATVAGTTYYIMVAPFGPPDTGADLAAGKTVLNVSGAIVSPPVLSASPTSQTVAAGNSATFTITDSGPATYILTCPGPLPTGVSCQAATASPTAAGSLIISTTSRAVSVPSAFGGRRIRFHPWPIASTTLAVSLVLLLAACKRKAFALAPLGALAMLVVFAVAGCTSSHTGPTTNPNGTPAGTYIIVVRGTSTGQPTQTASTIVSLTVQ